MTALTTLARTETKLFLRDPLTVVLGVALPAVVLAGLGAVPALRERSEVFGGLRFVEYFAPSLLAIRCSGSRRCPSAWRPTARRASCAGCRPPRSARRLCCSSSC